MENSKGFYHDIIIRITITTKTISLHTNILINELNYIDNNKN